MKYKRSLAVLASVGVLAAACGSSGSSDSSPTTTAPAGTADPAAGGETIEWEDVKAFIEYNSADDDYGFHVEFGGDPWDTATITDPDGTVVFDLKSSGSLGRQGLAGVLFESGEYGPDEVSRDDFLARFAEGDYTFTGQTVEGTTLHGVSEFTHLIPDPPTITSPTEDAIVDAGAVTVTWEPVTTPAGVEPEVYSLQLFPVDPPEGQPAIDLNIDYTLEVPPSVTEISIPPEILMRGVDYNFELLVLDAAGNQSYALGTFTTAG